MGASGPEIFADDLTCDVRDGYRQLIEDGPPDGEATRGTIAEWADLQPDEVPVFWLAFAAAQSRLGRRLEPEVRDRALAVIDADEDLSRWQELGREAGAARAAAPAGLREQVTGPQPSRRPVRRPWRYVTDLQPRTVLAWRTSTGGVVPLRVVQVRDRRDMSAPILEQLAWNGHDVPLGNVLAGLP